MGAESDAIVNGSEVETCPACEDNGQHSDFPERWYAPEQGNMVTCSAGHSFRLMKYLPAQGQPTKYVLGGRSPGGAA